MSVQSTHQYQGQPGNPGFTLPQHGHAHASHSHAPVPSPQPMALERAPSLGAGSAAAAGAGAPSAAAGAGAGAAASGAGTGGGAGPGGVSQLVQRRMLLEEELKTIEKQIFQLEENYIDDTAHYGNIIKGWDQFITARTKPSSRKPKISARDRIFSNSSVTAPVTHDVDDLEDYGTRSSTRAARRHVNYADSDEHDEDYEPP